MRSRIAIVVIALLAAWALATWATTGEAQESGFLSDYSKLLRN